MRLEIEIEEPQPDAELERQGAILYGYLLEHARIDDPRKAIEICDVLGLRRSNDSRIQSIVHNLRGVHSVLVGTSCKRENSGYFIARNQAEIMPTLNRIHSLAISNLFAWSGLKRGIVDERQGKLW